MNRKTQNSGVLVEVDDEKYYGVLVDIIELDYFGSFKVVLFRCDWIDIKSSRGLKKDSYGFNMINFSQLIHTGQALKDDPFIFSSQAKQVFYVQDPENTEWHYVIMTKPRDLYDLGTATEERNDETYTESLPTQNVVMVESLNNFSNWVRTDIEEDIGAKISIC
ncbi:hypothetical protein AXF42_Ash018348 [Apostasia shenzhenica]|uniref:DUF4216 domain-containing protein n=1 Tax=Apostasia shenzhenica TaxID=1088818 RepID=A0A2H9ZR89_9ASPA|nr:hypothetical protein AXF42_Ash018348 [Apostasia shenzhenica]